MTAGGPAVWHDRRVRILLIEDDERLAARTAEYLRDHQAEVTIVGDGTAGLDAAAKGAHDIVLLDLMLPGIDGLRLCKELRECSKVPVIMVSARGDEVDRIVGLEIGADDYLPKPFNPRELLARIRAVLRRNEGGETSGAQVTVASLEMDRVRHKAKLDGQDVELTSYQFDLLWVLANAGERVSSRAQLHARVRELREEPAIEFDPAVDRSIDVHLSKIRQALARAREGGDRLIKTIRGVGVVLAPEEL